MACSAQVSLLNGMRVNYLRDCYYCRPNLKELDYMNFGKQYQIFQKLLAVYDVEPDNFPRSSVNEFLFFWNHIFCSAYRLMELMFEIQQYGQIPAEIIKDIAPGTKYFFVYFLC